MLRFSLALAALIVLNTSAQEAPVAGLPASSGMIPEFKVASWNLQHFVDENDNPYYEQDTSPEHAKTPEQIDAIVNGIRALNADVLALQEIEGTDYLRSLAAERFPELGYTHFACAPDDTWHQNVAILSRCALGPMTSFGTVASPIVGTGEFTDLINDRLLAVEVHPTPGYSFLCIAVHLKAAPGPRNEGWRMGQIQMLREWIGTQTQLNPDLNVCVLGDFNCTPDSQEFDLWLEPETGNPFHSLIVEIGSPATHPSWAPALAIDNIVVNEAMWADRIEESGAVMDEVGDMNDSATDHIAVSARFMAIDR